MGERFALRGLAALLLLAVMSACSSTPDRSKPKVLADIEQPLLVKEVWRRGLAAGDHYVFQPAVVGTAIFAGGANGQVLRFEAGQEVWSVDLDEALSGGVAVGHDMLVAGSLKGEVLALSVQDGKVLWRASLGAEIVAPAAVLDDQVVVRTADHRIFGLDAKDGTRKWSYQRTIPPLSVRVTSAPVVAERLVFVGFPGGKLVAINTQSGQAVWEGTVAQAKGTTELERIADVVSAPVIGAKEVCAVAHQGRVSCFDLTNGSLLWARDISSSVNLALDNKSVYVVSDDGHVQAFDRVTGATLWKQDKLANRRLSGPLLHRGYLVLADDQGILHVLARDDGAFRGRFSLQAGKVDSSLVPFESGFVLQTRPGLLVHLHLEE